MCGISASQPTPPPPPRSHTFPPTPLSPVPFNVRGSVGGYLRLCVVLNFPSSTLPLLGSLPHFYTPYLNPFFSSSRPFSYTSLSPFPRTSCNNAEANNEVIFVPLIFVGTIPPLKLFVLFPELGDTYIHTYIYTRTPKLGPEGGNVINLHFSTYLPYIVQQPSSQRSQNTN